VPGKGPQQAGGRIGDAGRAGRVSDAGVRAIEHLRGKLDQPGGGAPAVGGESRKGRHGIVIKIERARLDQVGERFA